MLALRSLAERVALVVGGAAGLLLLEAVLQAASMYVAWTRPHDSRSWLRGGQRIVALGDSNTFGFFLERPSEEAYPHQMQEMWNARVDAEPIEVLRRCAAIQIFVILAQAGTQPVPECSALPSEVVSAFTRKSRNLKICEVTAGFPPARE